MAKPASLPEWASTTNYPAGAEPEAGTATKVAPTSSQEDYGWRPGAKPPAQEMNYWQNLVYQWINYLDASEIDDDLTVTGNLTVEGDTFLGDAVGDDTTITGDLSVGENAEVTGYVRVNGAFYYETPQTIMIGGGEWVDKVGAADNPPSASHTRLHSTANMHVGWTLGANTDRLILDISKYLRVGDRIISYTIYTKKDSNATVTLASRLHRYDYAAGTESNITAGDSDSSNAPSYNTNLSESLTQDVSAGNSFYIVFTPSASGGGDLLMGVALTITRPKP